MNQSFKRHTNMRRYFFIPHPSSFNLELWSLYWRLIGARVRAQMQYKISFVLEIGGFLLWTGLEFAVIAIIFSRFPSVAGWTIAEVGLLYGLSSIAFSFAEMAGRGFDAPFERMMQEGTFDTLLIRPLGSFFQTLAADFQLRRLGRTFQGMAVLTYSFIKAEIVWTPAKILAVPLTVACGTLIYVALVVIGATLCFWTIKTPEVINAFTFGGRELTSYPLDVYNRWVRGIFLSIAPVGFASYPAALLLLDRHDAVLPTWFVWLTPLVTALFFGAALSFWRVGVSKYQSAGS